MNNLNKEFFKDYRAILWFNVFYVNPLHLGKYLSIEVATIKTISGYLIKYVLKNNIKRSI